MLACNLTLGQNACFALPHVKLETQIRAKGLSSPTMPNLQPYTLSKTLVLRSRMSNLKPRFRPKVCLAPPCQAFNLTLGQNACFALPHVKHETQIRAKGLSSPTMPSLQPYIGAKHLFCAPACQKLETPIRAKGLSSPTMPSLQPYIGAKRLFKRSRMSNLKPKFGPKVCLAPPCQACNLTLGQNACSALPHVKLETQNRAKGLSSPTMPSFQPYIEQNACFALPHVKLETQIRAKGLSSPTMLSLQPYIGAKRLFSAPACQKLYTQIRAKGLSSPTMPSLQPYIGAKRLFCAPACQT